MAIFISHSSADDGIANKVYNRLRFHHSITCYIDDVDAELSRRRGGGQLISYLVNRIKQCDTLFAVVTQDTRQSWWVPFEIGTARQIPIIITSYTDLDDHPQFYGSNALPEYLLEWPRLRTENEIDIFAQKYKIRKAQSHLIESQFGDIQRESTRDFELNIMKALGQL